MFKRRKIRSLRQRLRDIFWPSMTWKRIRAYYSHRMGRLPGTPYYIAAGLATGVAVSFTPFIGFHLILGALVCWMLRGSIVAMLIGTVVGNPWTFPLIWFITYYVGHGMMANSGLLHGPDMGIETGGEPFKLTFDTLMDNPLELLVPMTLGCLPFVVVSWLVSFRVSLRVVTQYKELRMARIRAGRGHRGKKS